MLKDMRFADYFLYTQHSLATFDSCPLKFKKRYLENLKWDSFPDEEIRRRLEMGNNFHLLAHRYFMGVDSVPAGYTEMAPELEKWLESLRSTFKFKPGYIYLPEHKIRMSSGELKLEANFDLLIVKENSIEIWDWKTHTDNGKGRKDALETRLRNSLQTMVYMFVLKEQSVLITGKEIDAACISMHYWQPEPPRTVVEIRYTDQLHEKFREVIGNKIHNILEYSYDNFDKELYRKQCKICEFNWYCNNEKVDFNAIGEEDSLMDELDWDSVAEVF